MKGLQHLEYKKKVISDACQFRKQVKSSFKAKNQGLIKIDAYEPRPTQKYTRILLPL